MSGGRGPYGAWPVRRASGQQPAQKQEGAQRCRKGAAVSVRPLTHTPEEDPLIWPVFLHARCSRPSCPGETYLSCVSPLRSASTLPARRAASSHQEQQPPPSACAGALCAGCPRRRPRPRAGSTRMRQRTRPSVGAGKPRPSSAQARRALPNRESDVEGRAPTQAPFAGPGVAPARKGPRPEDGSGGHGDGKPFWSGGSETLPE